MEKNKVIIIGNDHSNTLGVIRALGENKIKSYLFIISDTDFVSVKKSKYVNKYWICRDEEEAMLTMSSFFKNEKTKPIIIPTSDKAALILDCNYERLSKNFILQNINNENNVIEKYMDKYEQYLLLQNYNLKVAKSIIVNEPYDNYNLEDSFKYPIIIKPLMSVEGKKSDIVVVKNQVELREALNNYKNNRYKRVFIQEFIKYDYECDMSGFCYDNNISIAGYIKKERIWPINKGSMTFGRAEKYENFQKEIKEIEKIFIDLNYTGMFDVEFFIKGNEIYLNEINFRNSGLTYLYKNSYLVYYYYLSCIEDKFNEAPKIESEYYVMDEQAEIHQIIEKNISYKKHNLDKKKCSIFLVKSKDDSMPSRLMFTYKLLRNLKIFYVINAFKKIYNKYKKSVVLECEYQRLRFNYKVNLNYEIIKINLDNVATYFESIETRKELKSGLKNNNIKAIVLVKDGELIARGTIKSKGAIDRFVSIKNKNSYLICNIFVNPKYRGNNLQCDVIKALVENYVNDKNNSLLYSIVFEYNIPSWRNFEKIGFKKIKSFSLIRFLKHGINKEKI